MAKKKGLWIPEELLRDEGLTLTDAVILAAVASLDKEDGCIAKNEYIAGLCKCHEKSVPRTLAKAERMGYITVGRGAGNGRIIHYVGNEMLRQGVTSCYGSVTKCYGRGNEMLPESEASSFISNNKTFNKTFYYSARAREEEQDSEKKQNQIPTEEDVERCCAEMGYTWDVRKFVRYNTARGWTVGGQPCADWRALADMWTDRDSEDDGAAEGSFDTEEFFQAALKRSREEIFGGGI